MKPTQPPQGSTGLGTVSPDRATMPEDSGSKVFFNYHSVEFAVRIQKGNEAAKVECTGLGHLIEDVMQCPSDGHLMCRKCCFPPGKIIPVNGHLMCCTSSLLPDKIIPVVCPEHQTPLFYDKLAGRSIRTQKVTCPANEVFNVACPWKGQYNEVIRHLHDCTFIPGPARVTMQNSMLKAADESAKQKCEQLEKLTACKIERIEGELQRKFNALRLLSDERTHNLMQHISNMAGQLNDLLQLQTCQLAVINPPVATPTALAASPEELAATPTALAASPEELAATPKALAASPQELAATLPALAATLPALAAISPALPAATVEEDRLPPFCDGKLTWKISGFSLKLELAKIDPTQVVLYSPAFYTSRIGYKMRVNLYPAGDDVGKGTHMSIFFQLMEGPFDGILTWPFRHKVTFMILDQNSKENVIDAFRPDPKSASFQRPRGIPNIASGCPLFFALKDLHTHGYLRGDTVYVQVDIDKD